MFLLNRLDKYVGRVGQRKKPQPNFIRVCSCGFTQDIRIWAPSNLDPEDVNEPKSRGNLEL